MRSIAEDAKTISVEFNVSEHAALAYLTMASEGDMNTDRIAEKLRISLEEAQSCVRVMISKGMVIRSPSDDDALQPLHPRMAITNLYKILEEENRLMLKQKRSVADSLSKRLSEPFENRPVSKQ